MKRNFVLNLIFIAIFIIFLVLTLIIDFFFFIPVICFLPFSFRTFRENKPYLEKRSSEPQLSRDFTYSEPRYCPKCGVKITKSIANFCDICGEKLNSN